MLSVSMFYVLLIIGIVILFGIFVLSVCGHQKIYEVVGVIAMMVLFGWIVGWGFGYGLSHNEIIQKTEIEIIDMVIDKNKTFKVIVVADGSNFTKTEAKYVNNDLKCYKIEKENRWGYNWIEYDFETVNLEKENK